MRMKFFFAVTIFSCQVSMSQNVGIGTTNPQSTLDVRGNQRFGGVTRFLTYDSVSGKIEWRNSYLFFPESQFLFKHSAAADGFYYNNSGGVTGQLEYRNALGEPVFYTNFTNGNGYFKSNLGIGTTNPLTRLHVFNGASGNVTPFTPLVVESNSATYINLLSPNFEESGLLFGKTNDAASGGIVYNNGNTLNGLQFRTNGNLTKMVISNEGNVSIGGGEYNAQASLEVFRGSSSPSGTAAFWGTNNISNFNHGTNEYTFIRGGKSNSHVILNDLGTGNVGVGLGNPTYKLDVSNRMRIRSGGSNVTSAGIWLNNNSNTEAAFLGMEDDTHIGFFGNSPAGWKFSMNTNTGALKVNGSEGQNGQVLKSNGSSAPSWATLGSFIKTVYATGPSTETVISNVNGWTELPPSLTITVDVKSRLIISGNFSLYGPDCSPCANGYGKFAITVGNFFIHNSNPEGFATVFMEANGEGAYTLANIMYDVQPGTYPIRFYAIRNATGNNYTMRSEFVSVMALPID